MTKISMADQSLYSIDTRRRWSKVPCKSENLVEIIQEAWERQKQNGLKNAEFNKPLQEETSIKLKNIDKKVVKDLLTKDRTMMNGTAPIYFDFETGSALSAKTKKARELADKKGLAKEIAKLNKLSKASLVKKLMAVQKDLATEKASHKETVKLLDHRTIQLQNADSEVSYLCQKRAKELDESRVTKESMQKELDALMEYAVSSKDKLEAIKADSITISKQAVAQTVTGHTNPRPTIERTLIKLVDLEVESIPETKHASKPEKKLENYGPLNPSEGPFQVPQMPIHPKPIRSGVYA